MSKKVVIISSSLRGGSNSDILAQAFAKGAGEVGCQVESISLKGKDIAFCHGCLKCQETKHCLIDDDANAITAKVLQADVVVFASPVYYYSISGQLKTLLDRMNALYASDYHFKDVWFLCSAYDDDEKRAPIGSISDIKGWVSCFENAKFAGTIFAGGVGGPREASGHVAEHEAYEAGRSLLADD